MPRSKEHHIERLFLNLKLLLFIKYCDKNEKEIQMLKEMAERQKTKKIIYLTIKEPWYNPDSLDPIVDRVIKLDCENDDPKEYQRILAAYEEDMKRRY